MLLLLEPALCAGSLAEEGRWLAVAVLACLHHPQSPLHDDPHDREFAALAISFLAVPPAAGDTTTALDSELEVLNLNMS